MKRTLATSSLLLFGESAFVGMSTAAERIATLSMLVLPAGIGAVLGVMSLMHKEGRRGLAITGIVLNSLFALFHLALVLFAG